MFEILEKLEISEEKYFHLRVSKIIENPDYKKKKIMRYEVEPKR